jgi:hypothetical protein
MYGSSRLNKEADIYFGAKAFNNKSVPVMFVHGLTSEWLVSDTSPVERLVMRVND